MTADLHCPMIHGGLTINLKTSNTDKIAVANCCLRKTVDVDPVNIWTNPALIPIRELNNKNVWAEGCNCQYIEATGQDSFRTGSLKMFGKQKNLVGPQRLDLMFDIGCNLACRTCGPHSSTSWQKHLIDNKIQSNFTITAESKAEEMIRIIKTLDLSELKLVVFCGGETLLGNGYWRVAETIAKLTNPQNITLSFQTNGTQFVDKKHYELIEKFHLVKLNISLDGTEKQFEYLRWPASWSQVTENIIRLKECLPVNTMFLIEETISIFNCYYHNQVSSWVKDNFSTNRLGDKVDHTKHLAHGIFSINNLSKEYKEALPKETAKLVAANWEENPEKILVMLKEIQKFDSIRQQNWHNVFPEVALFYKKFNSSNY
jgi:sulfatase maturation enzyme AslB (radical SAM superfamily)